MLSQIREWVGDVVSTWSEDWSEATPDERPLTQTHSDSIRPPATWKEEQDIVGIETRPKRLETNANLEWNLLPICVQAFASALPDIEHIRASNFDFRSRVTIIKLQLECINSWQTFLAASDLGDHKFAILSRAINDLFAVLATFIDNRVLDLCKSQDSKSDGQGHAGYSSYSYPLVIYS
jgi:hypothetical protein